jgi:NAD(P)-dependent dehydrogenase (short-subunit alcohol dehydrogenase family)
VVDFDESVPDYVALGRLEGRAAMVIGAGRGIGRHAAHALHAAGAQIAVVDRDAALAQALATEVEGIAITADVTREAGVRHALDAAGAALGQLNAVVDIVGGIPAFGSVLELSEADWATAYELNFRHATIVTRIAGKLLADSGGGSIVFIGSISGLGGAPGRAPYGSFKAALHSLVRTAGFELAPLNVRVNAVAPGLTATPRVVARLPDSAEIGKPGGFPQARDIGAAAYFLCTDLSRMITGHVLVVDAAQTMRHPVGVGGGVVTISSR